MKKMFLAVLIGLGLFFAGCNSDIVDGSEEVVIPAEELESVIDLPNGLHVEWQGDKYMDGEMAFTKEQIQTMLYGSQTRANGLINTRYRWSDRTVPYKFADGLSDQFKMRVIAGLEEFNTRTCIRVRPATDIDRDYVLITSEPNGIWSYVGRQGGEQKLNLQDNSWGTFSKGVVIRLMMNTLGFYNNAEIKRPDRDQYIELLWPNLKPGSEYIFQYYDTSLITNFGVEFDYNSIMSHSLSEFSKNGQPLFVSKTSTPYITDNEDFSEKDILSLNRMYGCQ